jgi:hypothetical protein
MGQVMHCERMENLVITGTIQGKREKILDGICRWLGVKDNKDIFRDVSDQDEQKKKKEKICLCGEEILIMNTLRTQTPRESNLH